MKRIFVSKFNKGIKESDYKIQVVRISKVEDVFKMLFAFNN